MVRRVANVSYPEGTNVSVGRYGKEQGTLLDRSEKENEAGKSKNKLVWKGKVAHKIVNKSPMMAGRNQLVFTEGTATTTYREARSNSRGACKKTDTKKLNSAEIAIA